MAINVRVEQSFYAIKVYIDNIIHLYIRRTQLIGFQAWRDNKTCLKIEFTLRDGTILTEYDDIEKFTQILNALDNVLK